MLVIKSTEKGYVANQVIDKGLFEPMGKTNVKVIYEKPFYNCDYKKLENGICSYISSFLPQNYEVKTNYVTLDEISGEDSKGKYFTELVFQIYI